jgi:hypothetical protein
MFKSDLHHGSVPGGFDDKHLQIRSDSALAHSLSSIPAGLDVVPTNDKHSHQAEKETVQSVPEAISQDEKEVSYMSAPPYEALALSEARRPHRRTCGLKSRYLWAVIVSLVLALALTVGPGAGLGIRKARKSQTCNPCMHSGRAVIGISDT